MDTKSTRTDLVSDADRDAERLITDVLRAERPEDGVLGEEGASSAGASGRTWVVDPLDGTVNFLYGNPQWCVSVAVTDSEGALAGVVHDPLRDETFRARRGGGAELAGARLEVREPPGLDTALLGTGFAYDRDVRTAQGDVVRALLPRVRDIRRAGAAALDLAWVAAGRLDAYYERGGFEWDWAAGRLLVEEAGGVVRRLEGEPEGLLATGQGLLAELMEIVGPPPP